MNIVISHPSERRAQADALRLALKTEGHEVFFDRSGLPTGEAFHKRLRDAVAAADLTNFFVRPEAVVADAMPLAAEAPAPGQRDRLWWLGCEQGLQVPEYRPSLLADVAAPAALATYRWLHPQDKVVDWRRPVWRLCEGILQARAGDRQGARASLQSVSDKMGADRARDRAARDARAVLKALGA